VHRYRTHFSIYTTAYTDARTTHRTVLYIQPSSEDEPSVSKHVDDIVKNSKIRSLI